MNTVSLYIFALLLFLRGALVLLNFYFALSSVEASSIFQRHSVNEMPRSKKSRITAGVAATTVPTNNHVSSAVLNELKETIRKQAAEIERLHTKNASTRNNDKNNSNVVPSLKRSASTLSSAHGGGGSVITDDELSLYVSRPFYSIAFERVGWLSLFLLSLSLTALIMNGFEHTLSRQLELAYFVPLLAGHGGNTGGQTVGTVLSAIGAGAVHLHDAPTVIRKEAMSGILAGTLLGCIVGPFSHYIMGISWPVSMVVWCTIPLVSTIAATLGSAIPFVCLALGLEPSVIAAPAMTSFVDITGLLSYFLIANQIFRIYGIEL